MHGTFTRPDAARGEAAPLPRDDRELLHYAGLDDPPEPAQGLFRDESWIRRVSGESVLLFGGGRALLLEVAHPLVAQGVADHSNFRRDPFGRLQRTLDAMRAITFADREAALAAARGVERAHARVVGTLREPTRRFAAGTPYRGRDPELMLFVWATLVDTALVVYERFVAELGGAARESYYAEQRVVARVLGVPEARVPASHAEFRAYFDALLESDVLEVTPTARAIGDAVLDPPGAALGPVKLLTAALLPPRLREPFGLRFDEARAARFEQLCASVRRLRARA